MSEYEAACEIRDEIGHLAATLNQRLPTVRELAACLVLAQCAARDFEDGVQGAAGAAADVAVAYADALVERLKQ